MTFADKKEYFTNRLGNAAVKAIENGVWGTDMRTLLKSEDSKKAFIYLNTLSRYIPGSSNSISEEDTDFIFSQLGKIFNE